MLPAPLLLMAAATIFTSGALTTPATGQSTVHLGPFYIDATPPTDPTSVHSTSHTTGVWSSNNTVTITWIDATDNASGLDGYSVLWDTSANTTPSANKTIEDGVQTITSAPLADGNSHYFHIRSVDNVGNWWPFRVNLGPFYIAVDAPFLTSGTVSPGSGYASTNFTFSVNYTDFENDAPVSITITTDNTTTANMTEQDSLDVDFTDGKIYEYSVLGSSLGLGSHTFQFAANDGTDDAIGDTGSNSGPAVSSPPSPPSNGGGGGGGGGGGLGGITPVLNVTSNEGRFLEDVTAASGDKNVEIYIPKNTIGKNRAGSLISSIRIEVEADRPPPPSATKVVGEVYDIKPDGAVFNPPITLTFKYDVEELPEGVAETVLAVHRWNLAEEQWDELESTVDQENHTVSAEIGGFSIYAAMARTLPASFALSDLTISPESIDLGSSANISVILTNTGDLTGTYEVSLMVDDVQTQVKEVTVNGGDSETVSFSVTPDTAGEHTVNIGDLAGQFEIIPTVSPPTRAAVAALPPTPAPASFAISDFTITPSKVEPAEHVTVSALVTNIGRMEGSYTVILKINGAEEAKKEVILGADKSETVTFTVAKDTEGSYTVSVDGMTGRFVVIASVPSTPEPTEAIPVTPPTNWELIGGIIAGCLVVGGLLVYFFVWRKRKTPSPS